MKQETYVAGCRATGKLHVGNYLGLVKDLVKTQEIENIERFYFIADQHAITTPFVPKELSDNAMSLTATYIALGIDPSKTVFFLQNQVLEHSWLAWVFNCITPLAELERMTQYKEKSSEHKENINAGLLTYPTLMAADILLYKPSKIPIGEDQIQHVELSRIVARKFNNKFGKTFPEPRPYALKPLRIMSLKHPEKKMSKTGDEPLYLDDEPKAIHEKIKKAVTATDGSGQSTGAENLLYLLSQFGTSEHVAQFATAKKDKSIKYSELKTILAEDISNYFAEFREKKKELLAHPETLAQILGDGAQKARKVASETLSEVKEKIGLL